MHVSHVAIFFYEVIVGVMLRVVKQVKYIKGSEGYMT